LELWVNFQTLTKITNCNPQFKPKAIELWSRRGFSNY